MFARITGSTLPSSLWEEPDASAIAGPLYAAEHQWVAAQRRSLGAIGQYERALWTDAPDLTDRTMRPARRSGSARTGGSGSGGRLRPPRAAAGGRALRRPPRLSGITAQPRPSLPAPQGAAPVSPDQLWRWISSASSFAELEGLCGAFLGASAFTARHAALAAHQAGRVSPGAHGQALLLMERLAARLAAALTGDCSSSGGSARGASGSTRSHTCGAAAGGSCGGGSNTSGTGSSSSGQAEAGGEHLLPSDVAGAIWGMAKVPGYACEHGLLQAMLGAASQQQQSNGQQLSASELAMLAAGLTAQGLPLPPWVSAGVLAQLHAGASEFQPHDLQQLLTAAAQHQQHQQQPEVQLAQPAASIGSAAAAAAATAAEDVRALCLAVARSCLQRLPEFSPEALTGVVLSLESLGLRGACGELFEQAAQLLVRRREEAARSRLRQQQHAQALLQQAGKPQQRGQRQQAGGDLSPRAAAASSRYSVLARHDPVLCIMLLRSGEQGGQGGSALPAFA